MVYQAILVQISAWAVAKGLPKCFYAATSNNSVASHADQAAE
jgi:hypothetical protein